MKKMGKNVLIILVLLAFSTNSFSQNIDCFGEKRELTLGRTTPYTKVKIGNIEGCFLIDFGTTGSTIDPNNFINGKPISSDKTKSSFEKFDFFGDWGTVNLNVQNHSNIEGLENFKQAGILGTDFLSLNIFTIDYVNKKIYRANYNNFCSDDSLIKMGFKATSTIGYYSNDKNKLNNTCVANIPTIPIKIGNISAMAQIDPGFDDFKFRHSVNINQAFFNALKDAGVMLIENPSSNLTLSTCVNNISELVIAYKLPKGVSFSITGIDGNPIILTSDANIFLKQTPANAKNCGGIGTWQIPAAQIGASFLLDAKKIIFDSFKSKVWFYTK